MARPGQQKRSRLRDPSFLIMLFMLIGAAVAAFLLKGIAGIGEGLLDGGETLLTVGPLLVMGFILAGMIQVLIPSNLVGRFMGEESGFAGVLAGIVVGIVLPGGPFITFPIAASLYRSGAGLGPLAAMLTSRNVLTIERSVVWELPFLGWQFVAVRIAVSLALPFLSALLVPPLVRLATRKARPGPTRAGDGW